MKKNLFSLLMVIALLPGLFSPDAISQIGKRFPSEKKVINDPVTGTPLTFLTSKQGMGDSKIYQTHPQWTYDGKWIVFRSNRVPGEGMAVNEESGVIMQITEGGYSGSLNVSRKDLKLFIMRRVPAAPTQQTAAQRRAERSAAAAQAPRQQMTERTPGAPVQIIEVDLGKVFADSEAGKMQKASSYERVCGTIPGEMEPGDMAVDANEDYAYFRIGTTEARKYRPAITPVPEFFVGRTGGQSQSGLASMNLKTGEIKFIVAVPFGIGHVQTNPFVTGEIVFCWETGGKAPQRMWTVKSDGSGLRPVYKETELEWITHEAVITADEVAFYIMGHRPIGLSYETDPNAPPMERDPRNPGQEKEWGPSGTREKPTGLGVVNLRTKEMRIEGQTKSGSGLWHGSGSADGRWLVGDDFSRSIYLIDRNNSEMIMLSTGHKETAQDHCHPSFSPDGTRIEIQSAMLSEDNRSMNICVMPVPKTWLNRTYSKTAPK
jgi:oligogalacturonide lyase